MARAFYIHKASNIYKPTPSRAPSVTQSASTATLAQHNSDAGVVLLSIIKNYNSQPRLADVCGRARGYARTFGNSQQADNSDDVSAGAWGISNY